MAESPQSLGRAACYDELLALCKLQIEAIAFNYEMLDTVAGFTVGYSTKLFGPGVKPATRRHFSHQSFDAYLEALGLEIELVVNPDKVARSQAFAAAMLLKCSAHDRANAFKRVTVAAPVISLTRDFMRKIGRKGALARAEKLRAIALERQRRSELYRANALKRWRKPPLEQTAA